MVVASSLCVGRTRQAGAAEITVRLVVLGVLALLSFGGKVVRLVVLGIPALHSFSGKSYRFFSLLFCGVQKCALFPLGLIYAHGIITYPLCAIYLCRCKSHAKFRCPPPSRSPVQRSPLLTTPFSSPTATVPTDVPTIFLRPRCQSAIRRRFRHIGFARVDQTVVPTTQRR